MKSVIVLIFSFIFTNALFSQNSRTIQFLDTVYHNPVNGVMVFSNGNFLTVSDDMGTCRINDTITEICCKYPGYKGRTLNIGNCDSCVFTLETNYNLLEEVEVKGKYNAKKHLLKLLKQSQQTAYKLDTNIYYKFKEINTIPELNQTEIFTGILRVENKGYSKKGNLIFISEISNYYNTIEQDIYKKDLNRILVEFVLDVLYPRNIRRLSRNNKIERPVFYKGDSISFLLFSKLDNIKTECNYISFINNKIKTREFAATIHNNDNLNKSYCKTDYSLSPISIPEHILSSRGYFLENGQLVSNTVELQKIDNPHIDPELHIFLFSSNCKELVKEANEKFPDIEIPCELIEE